MRMRNGFIVSALMIAGMFPVSPLLAQTASRPPAAATHAVPDLSGIWESPNELNTQLNPSGQRFDLCDEPACRSLLKLPPAHRLIITMEEPEMLPWAEEIFRATREEGSQDSNAPGRDDADPWFSACVRMSPVALMLSPFQAIELRQFPNLVLLLYADDHTVRRIYLDGRSHPVNLQPTSMGHSIGRYDGDTLVVDTIGIKGNRWLDPQGHPHSDMLHLLERIRRVNQKSLEVEVTIEDPQAYKNSWRKKIVRELAAPGPRIWDDVLCEELLQMGTHYSAESRK